MAKRRPTMDHSREVQPTEGGQNFVKFYNPLIYKPLPDKAGEEKSNKLFFSLMAPARWSLFNPTPEQVGRFNLVGSGNQLLSIPSDLTTFSFKVPVHPIMNFKRDDGTTGFASVLCPVAFNDYLMRVHGYGVLFDRPRCPYCEKSSEAWKVHNSRWEELGYDQERKKGLGPEEYKRVLASDSVLKKSRETARQFSTQDRYLVQVWDHSKFCGDRQMDEEQTTMQIQMWLAPKVVHDTLQMLYTDRIEFYNIIPELGVPIVNVKKDTTKCAGNNFSQTKYTIINTGKNEPYPSEWVEYLDNEEAWPDPVGSLIQLASYDDMRRCLLESDSSGSDDDAPPVKTFAAPPKQARPAPPTAPSFRAPVVAAVEEEEEAPEVETPKPAPPTAMKAPQVPSTPAPAPSVRQAPIPTTPPSAAPPPGFGPAPRAPGMERPAAPGKRHNW